jgi:hypothetical protein
MTTESPLMNETIQCPLCSGAGKLKRTEVLDRLGVKDFARVAQLSAEEAFRLLLSKHKQDEQSAWARFETELTKRVGEIKAQYNDELHALSARLRSEELEKERANRRAEDHQREIEQLREHSRSLEAEMSKVTRVGKREEMDFAEEAGTWPGICVSQKLPKNGDYILAYRDPSGAPLEPRMLVDNKHKQSVDEGDIDKLVRDAKERSISIAVLIARDESQLRQLDKECRWGCKDGIWVLRTTRQWLPRDLDVLKPLFERMRVQGFDFLEKNAVLAAEVRRTFADIDHIDKELRKAAKAIQSASGLVVKHKGRLQTVCETSHSQKISHGTKEENALLS